MHTTTGNLNDGVVINADWEWTEALCDILTQTELATITISKDKYVSSNLWCRYGWGRVGNSGMNG
jgi:hypothetical protein